MTLDTPYRDQQQQLQQQQCSLSKTAFNSTQRPYHTLLVTAAVLQCTGSIRSSQGDRNNSSCRSRSTQADLH
jgi:hypothetical protein